MYTYVCINIWAFSGGSDGEEYACNPGDRVQPRDWEDPLEKEMAIHSSILAWRFHAWMEEPGWSMGLKRVRHS